MAQGRMVVAHVTAETGRENYQVTIQAGHHTIAADEPTQLGGSDSGASPYALLLSSLAACTGITLKMYAERKNWPLEAVQVDLRYTRDGDDARIDRSIRVSGPLGEPERARLAEIAEKTPVTLTLKSGVEIKTELRVEAQSR